MNKAIFLFLTIVINVIAVAQKSSTVYQSSLTSSTVYFDSNKTELKPASSKVLDSIAAFLKDKTWQMDIKGYCDNTGIDRFNQILSDLRAEAVFNYLRTKNINSSGKFTFKGFSSSDPIEDNKTEEGKAKNRRVEIYVTVIAPPKEITEQIIEPEKAGNSVAIEKQKALDKDSKIEDLEVGKILVLENLNFVGGTATLLPESEPSLKLLLKVLKENPTMEIEIEGHVCCANDMVLSVDRALTVMEYLVNNGIREKRLKYAGHSWNNPLASDQTEEGRKQNRRVEIMILKK